MGRSSVGRAAALLVGGAGSRPTCYEPMRPITRGGADVFWDARTGSGVLHEGRDLLGEGWVYWMGVGGSCSMDNP